MEGQEAQISRWLENADPSEIQSLIDDTARFACRAFFAAIDASEGSLWWKYSQADYLEICYNSGSRAPKMEGEIRQPLAAGIVSMVYHTGEAVYTNQLQTNPEHCKEVDRQLSQNTQSMIVAPVLLGGEPTAIISAVILDDESSKDFDFSDLEAMQHLAEMLRSYWENQLSHLII